MPAGIVWLLYGPGYGLDCRGIVWLLYGPGYGLDCRGIVWLLYGPGYGLDCRAIVFRFPARSSRLSILEKVNIGPAAQPASYSVGTVFLPEIKRPESEADHSALFSAEVRNKWAS